jgi:hypothetical protein
MLEMQDSKNESLESIIGRKNHQDAYIRLNNFFKHLFLLLYKFGKGSTEKS